MNTKFDYFDATTSWQDRLNLYLAEQTNTEFLNANTHIIKNIITDKENSLRIVFNIGSAALLSYLRTGIYKNIYQRPVIAGKERKPSNGRIEVDTLLGLGSPEEYYFCAVCLSGTGIRFYGEHCVVLKKASEIQISFIFDRNSYDLIRPPLNTKRTNNKQVIKALKCRLLRSTTDPQLSEDMIALISLKVLFQTPPAVRLLTFGTISNLVLMDEDYIEALHHGEISLDNIEEIRENSQDSTLELEIQNRMTSGPLPNLSEMIWSSRRKTVRRLLYQHNIKRRTLTTTGRTNRW